MRWGKREIILRDQMGERERDQMRRYEREREIRRGERDQMGRERSDGGDRQGHKTGRWHQRWNSNGDRDQTGRVIR